MANYIFKY